CPGQLVGTAVVETAGSLVDCLDRGDAHVRRPAAVFTRAAIYTDRCRAADHSFRLAGPRFIAAQMADSSGYGGGDFLLHVCAWGVVSLGAARGGFFSGRTIPVGIDVAGGMGGGILSGCFIHRTSIGIALPGGGNGFAGLWPA